MIGRSLGKPRAVGGSTFPLPPFSLPSFPFSASSERRACSRRIRKEVACATANGVIRTLNKHGTPSRLLPAAVNPVRWDSVTSPSHKLKFSPVANSVSSNQREVLSHIRKASYRWVSCSSENFDTKFRNTCRDHTKQNPKDFSATYSIPTSSLPIDLNKLSLPSSKASVNLLDILPPEEAVRYSYENPSLFRVEEDVVNAPAVCLLRDRRQYPLLIKQLLEVDMIAFTLNPKVINGLFGVPKDGDKQRLIFDARRCNAAFIDSPMVDLPSPELLTKLQVDPHRKLYVAKTDLDNFYHRVRVPAWMYPWFALPGLRSQDVGLEDVYGYDVTIYPCLTSLPMGFSHSVFLAQTAHTHLIRSNTSFREVNRLCKTADFNLQSVFFCIYVDDLSLFGYDPGLLDSMLSEYILAMERIGLVVKASKTERPSATGMAVMGFWVDGSRHTVGVHPSKLYRLAQETSALWRHGNCSGLRLSEIVGGWTWALLARRPGFATFQAVYRFIRLAGKRRFDLWPSVEAELRDIVALAPMLFVSIAKPWFHRTIATDASSSGLGVCSTPLAPEYCTSLATQPLPNFPSVSRDMPDHLPPASEWSVIVSAPWRYPEHDNTLHDPEHINILEAKAVSTALRWATSCRHSFGSRLLVWSDSFVVCSALRKGRSSSFPMLRNLRSIMALLFAHDVLLYCNWIPTEVNPADEPSRRFPQRSSSPHHHLPFDSTLGYPGEGPPRLFLLEHKFKPGTLQLYEEGLHHFNTWLVNIRGMSGQTARQLSNAEFDRLIVDFAHYWYTLHNGRRRHVYTNALTALHHKFPERIFKQAGWALDGWKKLRPSKQHPPLSWKLTAMIALGFLFTNRRDIATALVLTYDCLFRNQELCNLRFRDVFIEKNSTAPAGYAVAFHLPDTKTGKQAVIIRSPVVTRLFLNYMLTQTVRMDDMTSAVFQLSSTEFLREFKHMCRKFRLPSDLVIHSLRHGGATELFLSGMSVADIRIRGRWATDQTPRHYIQPAEMLRINALTPIDCLQAMETCLPLLENYFSLAQ